MRGWQDSGWVPGKDMHPGSDSGEGVEWESAHGHPCRKGPGIKWVPQGPALALPSDGVPLRKGLLFLTWAPGDRGPAPYQETPRTPTGQSPLAHS